MYIVGQTFKSVISKVYNWFNNKDVVTPAKLEVVSTTYFVHQDGPRKDRIKKKRLTRMRVIKRTKEAMNEL